MQTFGICFWVEISNLINKWIAFLWQYMLFMVLNPTGPIVTPYVGMKMSPSIPEYLKDLNWEEKRMKTWNEYKIGPIVIQVLVWIRCIDPK